MNSASKGYYAFDEIEDVAIEPLAGGSHRIIVRGAGGELCQLRLPAGVSVGPIERLVPEGKLRRDERVA